MTSPVVPCCAYIFYSLLWFIFTLLLRVDIVSEMFNAITWRFTTIPWRLNPDKGVMDINGGPEVHEWLTRVFLPQLYTEDPSNNLADGYCTDTFPCLLNEGIAHSDNECARYLKKGENNCLSSHPRGDCCEPCHGDDCSYSTIQLHGELLNSTTKTTDISSACPSNDMPPWPSWLEYTPQWPKQADGTSAVKVPPDVNYTFCPERLGRLSQEGLPPAKLRTLMVAGFNQVLMGRISMKRVKKVPSDSALFKHAYPEYQADSHVSAYSQTDVDNQESFGVTETYEYQTSGGFSNAGGFIEYVDFNSSQVAVKAQLDKLKRNHWFDLNQGSFALELLFFNGNYEMFVHITFVFETDFNGNTEFKTELSPLNMSFLGLSTGIPLWICLVGIICGFVWFVKNEVDDISVDPVSYFTNVMQVMQFSSLCLTFTCLVSFGSVIFSYDYFTVALPLPGEFNDKVYEFDAIVGLSERMRIFQNVLAVNLMLIIMLCIFKMAQMTPFLSVVINSIGRAKTPLFAFIVVFVVLFLGFAFAGYFLAGGNVGLFGSLTYAFVTCLRMVMGDPMLDEIYSGDRVLGIGYFVCFHLFFLIIQKVLLQ